MARKTIYNQITTEESIRNINPKNRELCADFLDYLASVDRAPSTINGYRNDLDIFFCWNLQFNNNKLFKDIKKRELTRFQGYALNEWGWSPKRIRRVKSTLSSMSNYIENILQDEDDEYEDFKPIIRKIESPTNEPVRDKTIIPDEEVDKFLNKLVDEKRYQQACAFALAAMSGARKSELLRFKVEYFSDENIYIEGALYKTPKIKTKGHGKNGKQINKYVLYDFKKYLDLWMKERKKLGIESEWIFVHKCPDGTYEQMKVSTLDSWANIFSKELCADFLDYLASVDRAPSTINGYRNDLDIFFCWNLQFNNNKLFKDIKKRELTRFQGYALNEWGWSPKRIRRVKSTLSSMSNYIENILQDEDDEYEDFKPIIRKIESPTNEPVRDKTIIPDEEVDKFLNKLVDEKRYQQACAFALAAMSGARKSELLRFKVEYFSDENIYIEGALYKTPKIKTKGHGKNGKQINKYVLYDFKKYLDLWMKERKKLGIESEWIFVHKCPDGTYEQMKVSTLDSWANIFSKELCADFLDYLASVDRAPSTINGYRNDLDIFFCWNLQFNNNKLFKDIKKRELTRFQGYALNEWGWSPKRIRRVKSTLSSMSNYIENILQDEDDEYEDFKPIIRKIESPTNEPVRDKTIIPDEEVDKFLNKLVDEKRYQQACAFALAAMSGARKSELLRFKVEYFSDENIYIEGALYKTPKIKTKGHGKNGKQINKYVLYDFKKYLDLWMKERKKLGIESEWIFVHKCPDGTYEQMKVSTLDSWANIFSKELCADFLDYLASVDRAPSTINGYRNDLDIFFCWNLQFNNNKLFKDIKKRELTRFQGYALNEWGWSPKRIRRVKSTLSSMSNYIENILQDEDDEYEDFKPIIRKIESPTNEPVRDKTIIPDEEVDKFLNKLVDEKRYQQACAFALAAMSGARKSELLRFKVEYFSDENIYIEGALYKTPKIKTKGHGKNGKQINKYVLYDFKKYLDLWMKERKKLGIESEWIFVHKCPDGTYEQMKVSTLDSWANIFSKELCADFLDYLASVDRAPSTINGYRNDLDIFFCWNLQFNNNKLFKDIKKRELTRFQGYALNEWGWSPKRIRRVKSTLSSMSNYIENILQDEDDEYEDFKPIIRKIESPTNEPVRDKTIIPDEEVDKFLNKLVDEKRYQQACAFALAAMSGARKSELLRFKVEYFSDENIYIEGALYKTPKIKTKGHGKNGKQINKYVLYDFKKYLDLWMKERKKLGIESEWIFVHKCPDGTYEQMKVSTLDSWANIFSKELGVDFYWHAMRHYLTTKMKKYNIPDHVIKEYFQWNSVEMIGIYSDLDASEDFGKYFSKEGMVEGKSGSISDM